MKQTLGQLTAEYAAALREYFAEGSEAALLRAYQIGRFAIGEGMDVLEMAALHQEALVSVLLERLAPEDGATLTRRASEFFAESLAAFEMTRRGLKEANTILRDLNLELTRRIEAVLRDYKDAQLLLEEQRRMERLKNEFISVVSHELRTPLTSIHGSLGLLRRGLGGELAPEARRLLEVAHRNSERLVRLANEMLDLEKIESGVLVMDVRPLEVAPLLEHAIEANLAYAAQFGVGLVLSGAPPAAYVLGDADRLMQVLTNLISNAVKFSARGDVVTLAAERTGGAIRFVVIDKGPGIPADFRAKVFQKFAQADSSTTRQKGGTGLGLSISKAIVERLRGSIGFETDEGRGTTFFFELPEQSAETRDGAVAGG